MEKIEWNDPTAHTVEIPFIKIIIIFTFISAMLVNKNSRSIVHSHILDVNIR